MIDSAQNLTKSLRNSTQLVKQQMLSSSLNNIQQAQIRFRCICFSFSRITGRLNGSCPVTTQSMLVPLKYWRSSGAQERSQIGLLLHCKHVVAVNITSWLTTTHLTPNMYYTYIHPSHFTRCWIQLLTVTIIVLGLLMHITLSQSNNSNLTVTVSSFIVCVQYLLCCVIVSVFIVLFVLFHIQLFSLQVSH